MKYVLEPDDWQARMADHTQAMTQWTAPFRARRRVGQSHPVHDFLFVYYQYSPAKLEQWHPGVGVQLVDAGSAASWFQQLPYRVSDDQRVFCDLQQLDNKSKDRMAWILNLLLKTQSHQPNFGCCGLHEWAMVYQGTEIRHEKTVGLRVSQRQVDELVESHPVVCSHFDAFRFFTEEAQPFNLLHPTLEARPEFEQPACLHANMDLYKWCFKSMPWVGSDLLRRCFRLALDARAVDMRASPYDLSDFDGFDPIPVETSEGRVEYGQAQRKITEQAAPLRQELIDQIRHVLEMAEPSIHDGP